MNQRKIDIIEDFREFYQSVQKKQKYLNKMDQKLEWLKQEENAIPVDIIEYFFGKKFFKLNLGKNEQKQFEEQKAQMMELTQNDDEEEYEEGDEDEKYSQNDDEDEINSVKEQLKEEGLDEDEFNEVLEKSVIYIQSGDKKQLDDISLYLPMNSAQKLTSKLKDKHQQMTKSNKKKQQTKQRNNNQPENQKDDISLYLPGVSLNKAKNSNPQTKRSNKNTRQSIRESDNEYSDQDGNQEQKSISEEDDEYNEDQDDENDDEDQEDKDEYSKNQEDDNEDEQSENQESQKEESQDDENNSDYENINDRNFKKNKNDQSFCQEKPFIEDHELDSFKQKKQIGQDFQQVFNNKEFRPLYIYNNEVSEQKCFNIIYYQENFKKLIKNDHQDLIIEGFYGEEKSLKKKVMDFLQYQDFDLNKNAQGLQIQGLQIQKKFALVFVLPQDIINKKFDENNGVKELLKILQDICPQITICLNQHYKIYNCENQFVKRPDYGYQLKQNQQQNENLFKTRIQKANIKLKNNNYRFINQSKTLYEVKVTKQQTNQVEDITINKQSIYQRFYNTTNCEDEDLNLLDCLEYLKVLLNEIPDNLEIIDVTQNLIEIFRTFLNNEYKKEFEEDQKYIIKEVKLFKSTVSQEQKEKIGNDQRKRFRKFSKRDYHGKIQVIFKMVKKKIIGYLQQQHQEIENYLDISMSLCVFSYQIDNQNQLNKKLQLKQQIYKGNIQLDDEEDEDFQVKEILCLKDNKGILVLSQGQEYDLFYVFQLKDNKKVTFKYFLKLGQNDGYYLQNNTILKFNHSKKQITFIELDDNLKIQNNQKFQHRINFMQNVLYHQESKCLVYLDQQNNIKSLDMDNQNSSDLIKYKQYYKLLQTQDQNIFAAIDKNGNIDLFKDQQKIQEIELNSQINDQCQFEYFDDNFVIIQLKSKDLNIQMYNTKKQQIQKIKYDKIDKQIDQNYNTILDYFKCSQIQYGLRLAYDETNEIQLICEEKLVKPSRQHLNKIKLSSYNLSWKQNDKIDTIQIDKFQFILQTRVPISIAINEDLKLIPQNKQKSNLKNLIKDNNYEAQNFKLIENLVKKLNFEVYENTNNLKFDYLKVISVVGQQSKGKDLFLNEIFATRFNYQLNENYRGILMSLCSRKENEKDILYVVLNVEGFDQSNLKDQEQIRLSLVCAAISNLTIYFGSNKLEQEFDKFVDHLNLLRGKLNGDKLFKGDLLLLFEKEDQKQNDVLQQQLNLKIQQFLYENNQIFKNVYQKQLEKINSENYLFSVEEVKEDFIQKVKEVEYQYTDFVNDFKVVLIQVFLDDKYSMDQIQYQIYLKNETIRILWASQNFQYDTFMENKKVDFQDGKIFNQSNEVTLEEICQNYNRQIQEQVDNQNRIQEQKIQDKNKDQKILENVEHPLNKNKDLKNMKQLLLQYAEYSKENHDLFQQTFSIFSQKIIDTINTAAMEKFDTLINKDPQYKQINDKIEILFKKLLKKNNQQYQLCNKNCSTCSRKCIKQQNHISNNQRCDCFTDHKCIEYCHVSACEKNKKLCDQLYTSEHMHYCKDGKHFCTEKCTQHDSCDYQCRLQIGHKEQVHKCKVPQYCQEQCIVDGCSNKCIKKKEEGYHDPSQHFCQIIKCHQKCQLCDKQCIFKTHFHQKFINEKNQSQLMQDGVLMNYHICGNKHNCEELCEDEGECEIVYQVQNKQNKNLQNIVQKRMRKKCGIELEKYRLDHKDGQKHSCVVESHNHTCDQRCPQCNAYCQQKIGHDGMHFTNNHRIFEKAEAKLSQHNLDDNLIFCSYVCNTNNIKHKHKDLKNKNVDCSKFWKMFHWKKPTL